MDDFGPRIRRIFTGIPLSKFKGKTRGDNVPAVFVVGYSLDNAHGDSIMMRGIVGGYQEFVVQVETFLNDVTPERKAAFDKERDEHKDAAFLRDQFNIASLIAFVRKGNGKVLPADLRAIHTKIKTVTKPCRDDMHEPDEQEVYAHLIGTGRYADNNNVPTPSVVLRRIGGPKVTFKVLDLLTMAYIFAHAE